MCEHIVVPMTAHDVKIISLCNLYINYNILLYKSKSYRDKIIEKF